MRAMTLLSITALTCSLFAKKEPCDYVRTGSDAFGATYKSAAVYVAGIQGFAIVESTNDKGTTYRIEALFYMEADLLTTIPAGTIGKFAFEDGTVIDLPSTGESTPARNIKATDYSAKAYTQWKVVYEVDAETIFAFSKSPIKAIKTKSGQHDLVIWNFSGRDKKVVQNAALCIGQ